MDVIVLTNTIEKCEIECAVEGCLRSFNNRGHYIQHLKLKHSKTEIPHATETLYFCPHARCAHNFLSYGLLRQHLKRKHTEASNKVAYTPAIFELLPQPAYTCNIGNCGLIFRNRLQYSSHLVKKHKLQMLDSLKDKIFYCPIRQCKYHEEAGNQGFAKFANIKQHYQKVHLTKSYECSECSNKFVSAPQLQVHKKKGNCKQIYKCSHCETPYSLQSTRNRHEKRCRHLKYTATSPATSEVTNENPRTFRETDIAPVYCEFQDLQLLVDSALDYCNFSADDQMHNAAQWIELNNYSNNTNCSISTWLEPTNQQGNYAYQGHLNMETQTCLQHVDHTQQTEQSILGTKMPNLNLEISELQLSQGFDNLATKNAETQCEEHGSQLLCDKFMGHNPLIEGQTVCTQTNEAAETIFSQLDLVDTETQTNWPFTDRAQQTEYLFSDDDLISSPEAMEELFDASKINVPTQYDHRDLLLDNLFRDTETQTDWFINDAPTIDDSIDYGLYASMWTQTANYWHSELDLIDNETQTLGLTTDEAQQT